MKTETFSKKFTKSRTRAQFLFNDGEFKPRAEVTPKSYRRREKNFKNSYIMSYFSDKVV